MVNVHLIRSEEYSKERYWEVVDVLTAFDGPLVFIPHEDDIAIKEDELNERTVGGDQFRKMNVKIQPEEAPQLMEEDSMNAPPPSYKEYKDFEIPFDEKDVLNWESIFEKCNNARELFSFPNEDFVIFLTEKRNNHNWFTGGESGSLNLFVHTGYWDYFIDCPHQFPVAYECAASVLRRMMYNSMEELIDGVHNDSIGCMNDFCQQKDQIVLKLRTADICRSCIDQINASGIDTIVVKQVLSIIDGVRKQMLFSTGFSATQQLSRLKVVNPPYVCKIILMDYGNIEVKLTPLEKTLYLLYLNHPEGIAYHNLMDYRDEIDEIYSNLVTTGTNEDKIKRLDDLTNPVEKSVNEKVAKIKKKFIKKLGEELAQHYYIAGERGERKRIGLDREFVK